MPNSTVPSVICRIVTEFFRSTKEKEMITNRMKQEKKCLNILGLRTLFVISSPIYI